MTAIALLQLETDLPVSTIKDAIAKGALWLEKGKSVQRLRRVKKIIEVNSTLHFYYNEKVLSQHVPKAILIDDNQSYSIWYKPYGMLTNGSKWSDHCTITRWAQLNLPNERNCFLVHRLDRATSGLILIAHTKNAARAFSQLFEKHELTKCYQAFMFGNLTNAPSNILVDQPVDGKSALSHFTLLNKDEKLQLAEYEVRIETGRKHQIRQHAKYLSLPIVGDRLYGDKTANQTFNVDLQLCAVKLAFTCPLLAVNQCYQLPNELRLSMEKITNSALINSNN